MLHSGASLFRSQNPMCSGLERRQGPHHHTRWGADKAGTSLHLDHHAVEQAVPLSGRDSTAGSWHLRWHAVTRRSTPRGAEPMPPSKQSIITSVYTLSYSLARQHISLPFHALTLWTPCIIYTALLHLHIE